MRASSAGCFANLCHRLRAVRFRRRRDGGISRAAPREKLRCTASNRGMVADRRNRQRSRGVQVMQCRRAMKWKRDFDWCCAALRAYHLSGLSRPPRRSPRGTTAFARVRLATTCGALNKPEGLQHGNACTPPVTATPPRRAWCPHRSTRTRQVMRRLAAHIEEVCVVGRRSWRRKPKEAQWQNLRGRKETIARIRKNPSAWRQSWKWRPPIGTGKTRL